MDEIDSLMSELGEYEVHDDQVISKIAKTVVQLHLAVRTLDTIQIVAFSTSYLPSLIKFFRKLSYQLYKKARNIRDERTKIMIVLFSILDMSLFHISRSNAIDLCTNLLRQGLITELITTIRTFSRDLALQAGGLALLARILQLQPMSTATLVESNVIRLCFQAMKKYNSQNFIVGGYACDVLYRLCLSGGKDVALKIAQGGKDPTEQGFTGVDQLVDVIKLQDSQHREGMGHLQRRACNLILMCAYENARVAQHSLQFDQSLRLICSNPLFTFAYQKRSIRNECFARLGKELCLDTTIESARSDTDQQCILEEILGNELPSSIPSPLSSSSPQDEDHHHLLIDKLVECSDFKQQRTESTKTTSFADQFRQFQSHTKTVRAKDEDDDFLLDALAE